MNHLCNLTCWKHLTPYVINPISQALYMLLECTPPTIVCRSKMTGIKQKHMFSFLSLNVSGTLCSCRNTGNRLQHCKTQMCHNQLPFINVVHTLLGMLEYNISKTCIYLSANLTNDKPLFSHFKVIVRKLSLFDWVHFDPLFDIYTLTT